MSGSHQACPVGTAINVIKPALTLRAERRHHRTCVTLACRERMRHALTVIQTAGGFANGLITFSALAIFALITGSLAMRRLMPPDTPAVLKWTLSLAIGFIALFIVATIAGFAASLRTWLVPVMGLLGCSLALGQLTMHAHSLRPLQKIRKTLSGFDISDYAFLLVAGIVLGVSTAVAIEPPMAVDELSYHWASPLFWAEHHQWVRSPYKLSNGPSLAEGIYTLAATRHSAIAAHWLDTLALALIGLASAAIGSQLRLKVTLSCTVGVSVPLFVRQAPLAYSDLFHGAFVLAAVATITCAPLCRRTLLVAGLCLAAAGSVKIFAFADAAFMLPVLAYQLRGEHMPGLKPFVNACSWLALLPTLTLGFWLLRTWLLTGHLLDSSGAAIVQSAGNPSLDGGAAAGRVPTVGDLLKLPFVPFITGIIGQQEPYGGRTGLVLLVALPLALLCLVGFMSGDRLNRASVLLGSAYLAYEAFGVVLPKTRFSAWVWPVLALASLSICFDVLRRRAPGRLRLASAAVLVLCILQAADSLRVILRYPHGPGGRIVVGLVVSGRWLDPDRGRAFPPSQWVPAKSAIGDRRFPVIPVVAVEV